MRKKSMKFLFFKENMESFKKEIILWIRTQKKGLLQNLIVL